MIAGCQQKPSSGALLGLDGSLFSSDPVQITVSTGGGTSSSSSSSSKSSSGSMSLGAEIGIAITAVVILLLIAGTVVICYGKKRRAAKLAARSPRSQRDSYHRFGAGPTPPTPTWATSSAADDTPVTAGGYDSEKHAFSPYTSQYNSPVSARDQIDPNTLWEHHNRAVREAGGYNTAAYIPGVSGEKKSETVELEELRDKRIEERKKMDKMRGNEFLREAAERGFTTNVPPPAVLSPKIGVQMTFPPPPPRIVVGSPVKGKGLRGFRF
jgi:hypothetical protein